MGVSILLAEDDLDLAHIVSIYLARNGADVHTVIDGNDAFSYLIEHDVDLAILDWMMPGMSGVEVCCRIRSIGIPVKILMLTAKSATADEVRAFGCGADDYVRKPFEMEVLLARVGRLCGASGLLRSGSLELDLMRSRARYGNAEVELTRTECALLARLIEARGAVLTRASILDEVWGAGSSTTPRAVDTCVRRLRAKLGNDVIATRSGIGYSIGRCDAPRVNGAEESRG